MHMYKDELKKFSKSIWFFPAVLLIPLLLLTVFKISGSSIGIYNSFFYGSSKQDANLIVGQPRSIRSDEWLVASQQIAAQAASNFPRENVDIGNGQDMTTLDVPYKEWSVLFKPHNLVFFVLPFDFAFAFRWWAFAYLLIVSAYLFIVTLLPSRRLFAALTSVAFLFSPFVQWWYAYGTFASLYFSLFIITAGILLLRSPRLKAKLAWGFLIAYLLGCLFLVLYPPFQIVCGIIVLGLLIAFLVETSSSDKQALKQNILVALMAGILGISILGAFVITRLDVINTINSTAYPGQRIQLSGGYEVKHLFMGHLAPQHQSDEKSQKYDFKKEGITNQSEAAGFLMVSTFLVIPSLAMLRGTRKTATSRDWPLLITCLLSLMLLAQLFINQFNVFAKLLLLDKVPHNRLLIGFGLLGIVHLTLFIRHQEKFKDFKFSRVFVWIYVTVVLLLQLYLSHYAIVNFPGFIGAPKALILSLILPISLYFLLTRRYIMSAILLLLFSVASSIQVHPLYRGVDPLVENPLSTTIHRLSSKQPGKWAAESIILENMAAVNGAPSLSGVYAFPQENIWVKLDNGQEELESYNRYAHANFSFDRDQTQSVPSNISLISPDNFVIKTEACSSFIKLNAVRFIIALSPIKDSTGCLVLASKIDYSAMPLYIYELQY